MILSINYIYISKFFSLLYSDRNLVSYKSRKKNLEIYYMRSPSCISLKKSVKI